ncbi:transcriptional regulator [Rubrivivax gelatinosus]|uniref:helix-turn-helix domain-containing protein n=1 Tax=Rubrivivax gelatinosus TaxID=28068 RepID=UPI0019066826|nr:helix-turn-helix transcriptional regulator [Rubrivivax gelatinosus]MBK1615705.1 transcriptional regulator [Rubrivivax gelatinosus]
MSSEQSQLIVTIKRLLKAQGHTYRELAAALKLSEPSVKRLFSSQRLTVDRLAQIGDFLGYTMAEILQESADSMPRLQTLTLAQEAALVSNTKLLLVAVCAFNHWSVDDIVRAYRLSRAECLKQLLSMDRLQIIDLLPGDRIRLRVARDFAWLPDGPIHRFFMRQGVHDFLQGEPGAADQGLEFVYGMLTRDAQAELLVELRRLRTKLAALHDESASAPIGQRRGTSVLVAMRDWEPEGFRALRRSDTATG